MSLLNYNVAPMILSSLSSITVVRYQLIFIWAFFIFIFTQLGCLTVNNIVGLVFLRFLSSVACCFSLTHVCSGIFGYITEKYSIIM